MLCNEQDAANMPTIADNLSITQRNLSRVGLRVILRNLEPPSRSVRRRSLDGTGSFVP
jgi:hypothetical protein